MKYYENRGSNVIHDTDQDTTDFTKSLKQIKNHCGEDECSNWKVIVLGNFNGRLDHSMAMIHVLIMWESIFSNLLVISPECITFLLHAGLNKIHINTQYEGTTCGLIPFCIFLLLFNIIYYSAMR